MPDYIFLMHDDAVTDPAGWEPYLRELQRSRAFLGGSEIGDGVCARKSGAAGPIARHLTGFIRVTARDLEGANELLAGNPVFEAGGTVEIRELPRSD